jgi:hypothetical protein
MERRLGRLETLWRADPKAISEASYTIEWALRWPQWEDPAVRAARIRETHALDDAGAVRAIALALTRCGLPRGEAGRLADVGLENLLTMASEEAA